MFSDIIFEFIFFELLGVEEFGELGLGDEVDLELAEVWGGGEFVFIFLFSFFFVNVDGVVILKLRSILRVVIIFGFIIFLRRV